MAAYYNEIDPFAAAWLRELIKKNLITPGEVDERSIEDVLPADLAGFTQCHFFAGIGVWSYALRKAGWSDDRPVWTGSCPCQPFSAAGKGGGFADERHLWPAFFHLISQCQPNTVFGEQVGSKHGLAWLDLVQTDLEATGYTVGACNTPAAGFGAPHIRQRLYWVAHIANSRRQQFTGERSAKIRAKEAGPETQVQQPGADSSRMLRLDNTILTRLEGLTGHDGTAHGREITAGSATEASEPDRRSRPTPGPANGYWRDADWLLCRDGRWRPVEPGASPLAHGTAARVGRLRGYGNAIVAPQAEAFIKACMDEAY